MSLDAELLATYRPTANLEERRAMAEGRANAKTTEQRREDILRARRAQTG